MSHFESKSASSSLSQAAASSKSKCRVLVIDTGAFVTGAKLDSLGPDASYYTIPDVVSEIKDAQARHNYENFPYKIQQRSISAEAMKAVTEFARKTGDLSSLSSTDLRVLALTYMLEKERNGMKYIRSEPAPLQQQTKRAPSTPAPSTSAPASDEPIRRLCDELAPVAPFVLDDFLFMPAQQFQEKYSVAFERSSTEPAEPVVETPAKSDQPETAPVTTAEKSAEAPVSIAGWGDDGEGEWITEANLEKHVQTIRTDLRDDVELSDVACTTTDYAMQNVLLQMGLRLLSVNGLAVTSLRQFVMRCTLCFMTTREMERTYCPGCGRPSLLKSSMTVDHRGRVRFRHSLKKEFNLRGTKYSIPLPKGGRNNTDLRLREDVVAKGARAKQPGGISMKQIKGADLFEEGLYFGMQKSGLGQQRQTFGYGHINPNEVRKKTGNKKKRR